MIWLTQRERSHLAVLGLAAAAGLVLLAWQYQRAPLSIRRGRDPEEYARWDRLLEAGRRIDVNAAGVTELERLPRIGRAMAERIVAYRQTHGPFSTPEALMQVPGIGPHTFQVLKDSISVE